MKTQKIISVKAATTTVLFMAILTMVSCGGNKKNASEEKTQSAQTKPEPPAVDLHTATFLGDLETVQQHILAGSDLDVKEPGVGSTPLISAAMFGKTEVAKALIEGGANVNLQNNQGSTALHSAAFLCRTEIVKMLLENGADKDLKNIYDSTPLESVIGPFDEVKPIYDQFSKDLGPLGLKLDYKQLEETRPIIAEMLR